MELTLEEARQIVIFFGKKFARKTLGEVEKTERGLLWISWVATLNAVNGPQPRDQRIRFHRACQLLADHHADEISRAIESIDQHARNNGERRHQYNKQVPTEDV
ncbi:MAG: hypothetical protein Q8M02_12005 [Candidatus Didemnitutus sp.]|nr:hypothetical protein [Candidatus Didemnitutus sp.]